MFYIYLFACTCNLENSESFVLNVFIVVLCMQSKTKIQKPKCKGSSSAHQSENSFSVNAVSTTETLHVWEATSDGTPVQLTSNTNKPVLTVARGELQPGKYIFTVSGMVNV